MTTFKERPTVGRLIYVFPGRKTEVLEQYKPWGVLANLKKQYVAAGYIEKYLKLTY